MVHGGTAIALSLARNGHHVTLWSHTARVAALIAEHGENTAYLPGYKFPVNLHSTPDASAALAQAEVVISAMPSEHVRALYKAIAPLLHAEQILVSATKGIEDHTHLRISEIIAQTVAQTGRDERVGRSFSPDASVQSRGGGFNP